ncbi:Meiotic coiled-coil protein 2 [Penicillium oxalicum]|uniref:Meiotic coiled-coil protein 2 n=1 Tax=Penicillium oxalicum TaxID=69781 RepID=UPI0020B7D444|nr:Meiotic coiled-coil protein 2 [Penicillium oxalicum]KAI2794277.1 Meiotic coiled-coil protein 2 [Penicillium oxalicum]
MASTSGPPKATRMPKMHPQDEGQDIRHLSYNRDLKHASSRHIQSESDEVPNYAINLRVSADDVDVPSTKKPKLGHVKVESSVASSSHVDRILAQISPQAYPPTHLESDLNVQSSRPAQSSEAVSDPRLTKTVNYRSQESSASEVLRLKQELMAAKSKIAMQEQELAQSRIMRHTLDQALGPASEADLGRQDVNEPTLTTRQRAAFVAFRQDRSGWMSPDDAGSETSDTMPTAVYSRLRGRLMQQAFGTSGSSHPIDGMFASSNSAFQAPANQDLSRVWAAAPIYPAGAIVQPNSAVPRMIPTPTNSGFGFHSRQVPEQPQALSGSNNTPSRGLTRGPPAFSPTNANWGNESSGAHGGDDDSKTTALAAPTSSMTYPQYGGYPVGSYQTTSGLMALCPTASEFTTAAPNGPFWTSPPNTSVPLASTYVPSSEPLNFRRLLDKNIACDWKYIVEKIICDNDQQSSVFLQHKLKGGPAEHKFDIIDAIISQAYPLMVNRFGNFLIQRCFEHGTQEHAIAIANAIRGNTVPLSMDQFGCHVIQKALDCVSENYKIVMVNELLRNVPETVVHRYACHVWQKLFELRWTGKPPPIMTKVNEALKGMWHKVALGETGSLVVQNIFENCLEDEKRQAIEEVLKKIDDVAHGQFGNWCIQHICEHGAPHDKNRAVEHILKHAVDYSMDQFASKIVEKCLKIGGAEFLDRYLNRVCTGRADRPRMPLIDIAGDQYGNYLIQWILSHAAPQQYEVVASHIRKHMVSLRGSKFGSRVAMLCCNPSHATRPGPGTGVQGGRFGHFNEERYGSGHSSGGRYSRGNQWNSTHPSYR